MPYAATIDLTTEEDEHEVSTAEPVSQCLLVRQTLSDLNLSNVNPTTPKRKRKRSGAPVDNVPALSISTNSTLVEEGSSGKSSLSSATPSSKPSTKTSVDGPDDEAAPSKRAKRDPFHSAATPCIMAPSRIGAFEDEVRGSKQSTHRPLDLTLNGYEDVVTIVNRAFPLPNAQDARRASRLEILSLPIQIEDDEEAVSNKSVLETSNDNDSRKSLSEILTPDDFLRDRDLSRWLHNVQIEEEARKEAALNERVELNIFRGTGFSCAPGKAVELEDGSFLRIHTITKDGRGQVFVAGLHLVRQNFLGLKMPKRKNEVVWIQQTTESNRPGEPRLFEVSSTQVWKNREVVLTNQRFPAVSSRTDRDSLLDSSQNVELGPLFCRWKMTVVSGVKGRIIEESIEHLRFQDADDRVRRTNLDQDAYIRIADMRARFDWRQIPTIPGGSHLVVQQVQNIDGDDETMEAQAYTFGDAFCGAGGVSRGALDAGLSIKWGFDLDQQAIMTYDLNFSRGGTDCRHEAVHEFLQQIHANPPIVDIVHISPPCQPFSHAHTVDSPVRDERNQAALFSVWHLVETLKPRAVTIEETDALMSRHNEWFSALINILVNLGYSVRWARLRCESFGVPQPRKRLLIIASG